MSDEWGSWIEHDGSGCPCVGMYVQAVAVTDGWGTFTGTKATKTTGEGVCQGTKAWDWRYFGTLSGGWRIAKVIRYRIRKPRGMTVLENILTNLQREVENA